MFEFDQYQRRCCKDVGACPAGDYHPVSNIEQMSFMWWSEHCIECADPDCYASCDLYQSRPDGRCRRFVYGIHKNKRFRSLRGYGAEIEFKKWGKLEADGNVWMEPAAEVMRRERTLATKLPLLRLVGCLAARISRNPRWHSLESEPRKLVRRLHRHRLQNLTPSICRPDAFLLEVYNPGDEPVDVQLGMRLAKFAPIKPDSAQPLPFLTTLRLNTGYARHRIERRHFDEIVDSGLPFKVTIAPAGDRAVRLVFLTCDFVTERTQVPQSLSRRGPIKCVVFDLDDTVWTGVLLEGGPTRPKPETMRLLHELDRRGILLSIASKNDHDEAWARMEALGLADLFLHPQIGWKPKSVGIQRIAERLNLGLDAFAFIDDNPFELEQVAATLPEVTCIGINDLDGVPDNPRFAGSTSIEAGCRRQYYKDEMLRTVRREQWGEDYLGFLRSCGLELTVKRYESCDFDRVVELVQRTNQLNFSGHKYDRKEILAILEDLHLIVYVLSCRDKFGAYGTVGVVIIRCLDTEISVEDFMVSCRVQGRYIEQAFFAHATQALRGENRNRLRVRFRPTPRNTPAREILERLEFAWDDERKGYILNVAERDLHCDVVRVCVEDSENSPHVDTNVTTAA